MMLCTLLAVLLGCDWLPHDQTTINAVAAIYDVTPYQPSAMRRAIAETWDAPPSADAVRLGYRHWTETWPIVQRIDAEIADVELQRGVHPTFRDWGDDLLAWLQYRRRAWDKLDDVYRTNDVTTRRLHLAALRGMIGAEAYSKGMMP